MLLLFAAVLHDCDVSSTRNGAFTVRPHVGFAVLRVAVQAPFFVVRMTPTARNLRFTTAFNDARLFHSLSNCLSAASAMTVPG